MSYIPLNDREKFKDNIKQLTKLTENIGELKYVISELVGSWIIQQKLYSYTGISNVIGAVHDVEIELHRRILAPYEAGKILQIEDLNSFKRILDALKFMIGEKNYVKRDLGRPHPE